MTWKGKATRSMRSPKRRRGDAPHGGEAAALRRIARAEVVGGLFAALLLVVLVMLLTGCGHSRALSTASPDVGVDKHQSMFNGENANVTVPPEVKLTLEGDVPQVVHGDFVVGLFVQRHSANSETGIDSVLENATKLSDLFDLKLDTQVNAGGGAGSQGGDEEP